MNTGPVHHMIGLLVLRVGQRVQTAMYRSLLMFTKYTKQTDV